MSKAGESELSDYHIKRTARARPGSPPRNLKVEKPKSNALTLSWDVPEKPNGPIDNLTYQVQYSYRDHRKKFIENSTTTNGLYIRLENLAYSASYELKVKACGLVEESLDPVCGGWGAINDVHTGIGRKYTYDNGIEKIFLAQISSRSINFETLKSFWNCKLDFRAKVRKLG